MNAPSVSVELSDGSWTARWRCSDGSRPRYKICRAAGVSRERAKDMFLAKVEQGLVALNPPTKPAPTPPRETTIGDLIDRWLPILRSDERLKQGTRADYVLLLTSCVRPAIGDVPWSAFTPARLAAWLDSIPARGSVRNKRNLASKLCRYALSHGWVSGENPCRSELVQDHVPSRRRGSALSKPRLTEEQARTLLASVDDPVWHLRYLIALSSGLRDAEIAGLRWRSLAMHGGVLCYDISSTLARGRRVETTKTESSTRLVPVHPMAADALDIWRGVGWREHTGRDPEDDDFVLADPDGNPWRPTEVARRYRADLEKAGLPTRTPTGARYTFHSIRGTALSWIASHGCAPDVLRFVSGHAATEVCGDYYLAILPMLPAMARAVASIELRDDDDESGPVAGGPFSIAAVRQTAENRQKTTALQEIHRARGPV